SSASPERPESGRVFRCSRSGRCPREMSVERRLLACVLLLACAATLPLTFLPDLIDARSEEHTSELQSRENLVCRLLLEKNNNQVVASRAQQLLATTWILDLPAKTDI